MYKSNQPATFIEPYHLAAYTLPLRVASPRVAQLLACPTTEVVVVIQHPRPQFTSTRTISELAFVEYLPYHVKGNILRF